MSSTTSSRAAKCLWGHRSLGLERPKASAAHTWTTSFWAASASLQRNGRRAAPAVRQRSHAVAHGPLECRLPAARRRQTTSVPDRPLTIGLVRHEPTASAPSDLVKPDRTTRIYRLPDLPC